jgi:hypothetical protein
MNSDNYLSSLNATYNNLMEITKIEKEPDKIKELEREINKITVTIQAVSSLINYYKMKEIKTKAKAK